MSTLTPAETRDVPTRLGSLHVRVTGAATSPGTTVVLWPSMFVDSHSWDLLLPLLPADRQYLLVDGPGLGLSSPLDRESDIAEAADAAVDLLAAMEIDGPVDWVGNAFGGHVGFKLAARAGMLRSLVAISSPSEPVPAALLRQIALLKPILRVAGPIGPVRNAVISAMLTDRSAADPALRAVVLDSLTRPSRRSLSYALKSFILNRADVTEELAAVAVPCLYVASDDRGDWSPSDAAAAARRTPNATAVTIPGARTLIPLEQPVLLAEHLTAFWDR